MEIITKSSTIEEEKTQNFNSITIVAVAVVISKVGQECSNLALQIIDKKQQIIVKSTNRRSTAATSSVVEEVLLVLSPPPSLTKLTIVAVKTTEEEYSKQLIW